MKIQTITNLHTAHQAKGITVVIDVLRAFTTTCYLFANGAKTLISVADLDEAYAIKKSHPSYLLIGERKGIKPADFDWGNSPAEIQTVPFQNKTIIFTTSAGTLGIHKAIHADTTITGAFVNASAVARFIQKRKPDYVTFLCTNDTSQDNEDIICAQYLTSLLQGASMDFQKIKQHMASHPSADGFIHHPMTEWSRMDYSLCMSCDTFDFVIQATKKKHIFLHRI